MKTTINYTSNLTQIKIKWIIPFKTTVLALVIKEAWLLWSNSYTIYKKQTHKLITQIAWGAEDRGLIQSNTGQYIQIHNLYIHIDIQTYNSIYSMCPHSRWVMLKAFTESKLVSTEVNAEGNHTINQCR